MKKILLGILCLTLVSLVVIAQDSGQGTTKVNKSAAPVTPATDTEIQSCIAEKFKERKTLSNPNVSVSKGEATLTGEASSGGAKGQASRTAKLCGATKVINNMTVPPKEKKQ